MKRISLTLATIVLLAAGCLAQVAQYVNNGSYGLQAYKINGQLVASRFNYSITPLGTNNNFAQWTNFPDGCMMSLGGGVRTDPFNTNATVTITDLANAANTETVALNSHTNTPPNCTLSLANNNTHTAYIISSGTCGLKEALNYGGTSSVILVNQEFYDQGCTASTITGLTGAAVGNIIHDVSNGKDQFYTWNGSAFVSSFLINNVGVTASLAPNMSVANASVTGTTVNTIAKLTGAPSTAVIAATTDTKNNAVVGIVTAGAGTTGSASISTVGIVACAFDAGATTAGDFVGVSSTTAGKCKDLGATVPLDGSVVLGRVLATTAGGVNANVLLFPPTNNSLAQAVTGTGSAVLATNAVMVTPTLGAATATTLNGNTFTTGTYTLTGVAGKTFTFNNTMTFAGTDAQTYTFPTATDTMVGRASTDTFTVGVKTFGAPSAGTGGQFLMATGGTKPTTVSQGGIYWEPTQNALVQGETSGEPVVIGGAFAVLPQQTAITTVTTAQTLNGLTAVTLPAGAMNVIGKTLHVHGMLIFSNGATTPTVAISLKIGSVVELIPTSAANANTNSNSPVYFDFYVTTAATGATGNDQAHGIIQDNTASAVVGAAMNTFGDANAGVSGNWDHTASQTVLLQLTCGGAACTTATLNQATFEIIN